LSAQGLHEDGLEAAPDGGRRRYSPKALRDASADVPEAYSNRFCFRVSVQAHLPKDICVAQCKMKGAQKWLVLVHERSCLVRFNVMALIGVCKHRPSPLQLRDCSVLELEPGCKQPRSPPHPTLTMERCSLRHWCWWTLPTSKIVKI
jgi:hypothetical protein